MKTIIGWLCYRIFMASTPEMVDKFPRSAGCVLSWAGWYANKDEK
jgi:hypothetical protein